MPSKSAQQYNLPTKLRQPMTDLGQAVKTNPMSPKDLADAAGIEFDPNDPNSQSQFATALPALTEQHNQGIKSNEQILEDQKKVEQGLINMQNVQKDLSTVSSRKSFNFKKAQFSPVSPMDQNMGDFHEVGQMQEPEMPQENNPQFKSHVELKEFLVSNMGDQEEIRHMFFNDAGDDNLDNIKMALENFFSKAAIKEVGEEVLLDAANIVYDFIPESMKAANPDGQQTIVTEKTSPDRFSNIMSCLEKTANHIKKLAEEYVSKKINQKKASYNQKKIAQHKTVDNMLLWGPGNPRPDPFLRGQPVSDWHIVERNKGFGQDIDGVWNIDWEAMWRGNVMDKYSRPYRDKEGNWVGGYLEKRFEVDKNIPEANNYQLKPGQRRRPYLPEFGSTEARLEDARKKNKEGGKTEDWSKSEFSEMKVASLRSSSAKWQGIKKLANSSSKGQSSKGQLLWDALGDHPNTQSLSLAEFGKLYNYLLKHIDSIVKFDMETLSMEIRSYLGDENSNTVSTSPMVASSGFNLKKIASLDKKKSELKESQIGSGIGGGRPPKDPFSMTLPGEEVKDTSPQKACAVCGRHCSKNDAKCPYCNGQVVDIGQKATQPAATGVQKPHNEYLNQNMPITASEVVYDSRSGKFTIAQVGVINPGDAQLRRFRGRKKGYPLTDKDGKPVKPLPQLNDFVGKEFQTSKDMADPNDPDYWKIKSNDDSKCRPNQDEISHSCTSLAIDG